MRTMRMIWNKNAHNRKCAACGRPLGGLRTWAVHVIDGGGKVLHPQDEKLYTPDGGDMGCHMIGPECRKQFGEFAIVWRPFS